MNYCIHRKSLLIEGSKNQYEVEMFLDRIHLSEPNDVLIIESRLNATNEIIEREHLLYCDRLKIAIWISKSNLVGEAKRFIMPLLDKWNQKSLDNGLYYPSVARKSKMVQLMEENYKYDALVDDLNREVKSMATNVEFEEFWD
jgi:hypothetical protein